MKRKKIFFLTILFTIFFAYMTNIEKIPENITLFQNEKYQIEYLKGIEINGENINQDDRILSNFAIINTEVIGNLKLNLSTFWGIFNKTITVNVVPTVEVIPGGDCIGVKLYSKGALVVGESKIQGIDGEWHETYNQGTFKPGDILLKIDEYEIESAEEVANIINNIGDKEVNVTYLRDGEMIQKKVKPRKCLDDGKYKIGLWVRDGAMGVGTLTFYLPEYSSFAALGHGISDEDAKSLIKLEDGAIYDANVISINKGKTSKPGEIKGFLDESSKIGEVIVNSTNGIYGEYDKNLEILNSREKIKVASRHEIKTGPATILCTIDESQTIKEYDIEIQKISSSNYGASNNMTIKIVDEELLRKTGGIIQGMSGSPIIQNGKLIGAVTHVYVNDPTKGNAIFAETMIEEIKQNYK